LFFQCKVPLQPVYMVALECCIDWLGFLHFVVGMGGTYGILLGFTCGRGHINLLPIVLGWSALKNSWLLYYTSNSTRSINGCMSSFEMDYKPNLTYFPEFPFYRSIILVYTLASIILGSGFLFGCRRLGIDFLPQFLYGGV